MSTHRLVSATIAALLVALLLAPGRARAADVDALGAFNTRVELEVLPFHSLTPRIALTYNSQVGGGLAGVGWSLEATSYIVRASPGGGAPAYSSADVFLLDGLELIPCSLGNTSPSCVTSASLPFGALEDFHSTELESFRRIYHDPGADTWTVWDPDGTVSTYIAQPFSNQLGTYRWALAETKDTHGNKVTYSYWCDYIHEDGVTLRRECYLDKISYIVPRTLALGSLEGAVIKFFYEQRPDVATYATGHLLAVARQRLKTIQVKFAGTSVRALELGYDHSHATGASVLASVQQFASDAAVDPSTGAVTVGATAPLPPTKFAAPSLTAPAGPWSPASATAVTSPGVATTTYPDPFQGVTFQHSWWPEYEGAHLWLDVDGDGRTDFLSYSASEYCDWLILAVIFSRPGGSPTPVTSYVPFPGNWTCSGFPTTCSCQVLGLKLHVASLNGDRMADLLLETTEWTGSAHVVHLQPAVGNGQGSFVTSAVAQPTIGSASASPSCATGDLNADGLTDVACSYEDGLSQQRLGTAISDGNGSFDVYDTSSPVSDRAHEFSLGDMNGDGRSDVLFTDTSASCADGSSSCSCFYYQPFGTLTNCPFIQLRWGVSDGTGGYVWATQETTWARILSRSYRLLTPDVNGDGRADLVLLPSRSSGWNGGVVPGFTAVTVDGLKRFELHQQYVPHHASSDYSAADFNGDGKSDLFVYLAHGGHPANGCTPAMAGDHVAAVKILSLGDGTFDWPSDYTACTTLIETSWTGKSSRQPEAADVNGDHRDDLVGVDHGNGVRSLPSDATWEDRFRWRPTDVNGDGRRDLVYVAHSSPGYQIVTLLQDASGVSYTRVSQTIAAHPATPIVNQTLAPGQVPTDSPDTARWMMMDVGFADGKADLVFLDHDGTTLQSYVLLGNGDGTFLPVYSTPWRDAAGTVLAFHERDLGNWQAMDTNRDGRQDLVHTTFTNPGLRVDTLVARGDGTWEPNAEYHFANLTDGDVRNWQGMDVNGDGCADLVHLSAKHNPGGTRVRTLFSRCLGVGAFTEADQMVAAPFADVRNWRAVDGNGDGLTDLAYVHWHPSAPASVGLHFLLSRGDGRWTIENAGAFTPTAPLRADNITAFRFGDVNGDGLTDLLKPTTYASPAGDPVTGVFLIRHEGRGRTVASTHLDLPDAPADPAGWYATDTDADGLADLVYVDSAQVRRLRWASPTDRMNLAENGLGGVTAVTYRSSAGMHGYWPIGAVLPLVANVEHRVVEPSGAFGSSTTTSYAYSGLQWSARRRRATGFYTITSSDGTQQHEIMYGTNELSGPRIAWSVHKDLAGNVFSYSITKDQVTNYGPHGGPPSAFQAEVRWEWICERGPCRQTTTQWIYDTRYGQVVRSYEWGRTGEADDVLVDGPTYPNDEKYLLDRPMRRNVFQCAPGVSPCSWQLLEETRYLYDGNSTFSAPPGSKGELTQIWRFDDRTSSYATTTLGYDAEGNLTSVIDPMAKQWNVGYDVDYNLYPTSYWTAGQLIVRGIFWKYATAQPWKELDENGGLTFHDYDAHGRFRSTVFPDGSWTKEIPLDLGTAQQRLRVEVSDGSADGLLWKETSLDGFLRPTRTVHEGGATRETFYTDASRRPGLQTNLYGSPWERAETQYRYDEAKRRTAVDHADGSGTRVVYASGSQEGVDEMGRIQLIRHDALGRLDQVTELNRPTPGTLVSHITRYEHDGLDRLTKVTDDQGNVTTTTYDSLSRVIKACNPDRGCTSYDYFPNDLLRRRVDAKGQIVEFYYDALGRLIVKNYLDSNGSIVRQAVWWWDRDPQTLALRGASVGHITAMSDSGSGATEKLDYDNMGRVILDERCLNAFGLCFTFGYAYDLAGRLAAINYPGQDGTLGAGAEWVSYAYDDAGDLVYMPGFVDYFQHEADGRPRSMIYFNGLSTSWTYDSYRGWLTDVLVTNPQQGSYPYYAHYDRDPTGKATAWYTMLDQTTMRTRQLTYDDLGRLTQVVVPQDNSLDQTLTYDALGSITSNSRFGGAYTYGDPSHPHAVTQANGHQYSYDANGNLYSDSDSTGLQRYFEYDHEDRLARSYQAEPGVPNSWLTTVYAYDADGNRVMKSGPNGATYYFGPLLEVLGSGEIIKNYYADGRRVAHRDDAGLTFVTSDHLGSERVVTDGWGQVLGAHDYDAFGNRAPVSSLTKSASKATDQRGFGDHVRDNESGLVYLGARYYDPAMARFISADTIVAEPVDPQSWNRYSYVRNDPVGRVDPDGHQDVGVGYSTFRYLAPQGAYEIRFHGFHADWQAEAWGNTMGHTLLGQTFSSTRIVDAPLSPPPLVAAELPIPPPSLVQPVSTLHFPPMDIVGHMPTVQPIPPPPVVADPDKVKRHQDIARRYKILADAENTGEALADTGEDLEKWMGSIDKACGVLPCGPGGKLAKGLKHAGTVMKIGGKAIKGVGKGGTRSIADNGGKGAREGTKEAVSKGTEAVVGDVLESLGMPKAVVDKVTGDIAKTVADTIDEQVGQEVEDRVRKAIEEKGGDQVKVPIIELVP